MAKTAVKRENHRVRFIHLRRAMKDASESDAVNTRILKPDTSDDRFKKASDVTYDEILIYIFIPLVVSLDIFGFKTGSYDPTGIIDCLLVLAYYKIMIMTIHIKNWKERDISLPGQFL